MKANLVWGVLALAMAGTCLTCAGPSAGHGTTEEALAPAGSDWFCLTDGASADRVGCWNVDVKASEASLEVTERLSMLQGDETGAYLTEVQYDLRPRVLARKAEVTTYANGKPYMGATLEIKGDNLDLTSALVDKEGRPIKPLHEESIDLPAGGTVLFQQGLPFVAERLLKDRKEIGNVYLVAAPSNVGVMAQISGPFRLAETGSDKEGVNYALFDKDSDEPACHWTIGSDGHVRSGCLYQTAFARTTEKDALTPPAPPEK